MSRTKCKTRLAAGVALTWAAAALASPILAAEAWSYRSERSLTGEMTHIAAYALSPDRNVHFEVGCGPSGAPWIAVAVNDPDVALRGLAEDSAIPVTFTFVAPSSIGLSFLDDRDRFATAGLPQRPAGGVFTVRITGPDVADLADRLAGGYSYVEVKQGRTTATFPLAGAAAALRQVREGCPGWPR
jgi:hypothetical protein